MKKKIILRFFYFALGGILLGGNSVEIAASNQLIGKAFLADQENRGRIYIGDVYAKVLQKDEKQQPKRVFISLRGWEAGRISLSGIFVNKITEIIKKKYGKNIEVVFAIPWNLKNIGPYAFESMKKNLVGIKTFSGNELRCIYEYAFSGCTLLQFFKTGCQGSSVFPNLTFIGEQAFKDCNLETPPFDEQTPLKEIGYTAFEGNKFAHLRIPKALEGELNIASIFASHLPESIFIPSEAKLKRFIIQNKQGCHPSLFFEPGSSFLNLIIRLRRVTENFQYDSDESKMSSDYCSPIILGKPEDSTPVYKKNSIFLWKHAAFLGEDSQSVPNHKISFSSSTPFSELVQNAHDAYIKCKSEKNDPDKNIAILFKCLPVDFIPYALSQDAKELLNQLKENEQLSAFAYRIFTLIRFLVGVPDRDLPDLDPDDSFPDFIKNSFIVEKTKNNNKQEETDSKQRQIVDIIVNDLIDDFQVFCSQNNFSLDTKLNRSGFVLNPDIFTGSISWNFPDGLSLMELAALFGSTQIFKFLVMNSASISKNCFLFACFGGSYDIIHLLEGQKLNILSKEELEYLIKYVPDVNISSYLCDTY